MKTSGPTTPTPALANQTVPSGFQEYINTGYGIRMIYPDNFEIVPPEIGDTSGLIVNFVSGVESTLDPYQESVDIFRIVLPSGPKDLEAITNGQIEIDSGIYPDFALVNSDANYELAGRTAFKYEFTSTDPELGIPLRCNYRPRLPKRPLSCPRVVHCKLRVILKELKYIMIVQFLLTFILGPLNIFLKPNNIPFTRAYTQRSTPKNVKSIKSTI